MKNRLFSVTTLASLLLVFAGCQKMGPIDSRLAEVKEFLEPATGKTLDLTPTGSLYFEWEYVDEAAAGAVVYQVAFDKADGDFSNPVFLVRSDNNGMKNSVTLTHKQLNKIAGLMGVKPTEKSTFKWTVIASKGLATAKAAKEYEMTVTRLAGFADIPVDVYITGEGSEGGNDLSKAQKLAAPSNGVFEAYTRLKAGKPYFFTDGNKGDTRKFFTTGGLVKEDGTSTVEADGVYRITMDFETGASSYALVERVCFYFSPEGKILFDLPYVGNGTFSTRATVNFKKESWGGDERYKFRMFVKEEGGQGAEKELEWCTLNGTDARPTPTSPASYYYLLLTDKVSQWDNKWKLMGDFDGVEATYTVKLNADGPYTHSVVK